MSLINQMLKDLESRRASDDLAQRAVEGMGAAAKRRQRKQNILLLSLVVLIAVLASISAYLLWQERQSALPVQTADSAAVASLEPQKKSAKIEAQETPVAKKPVQQDRKPVQLVKKAPARPAPIRETPAGITLPDDEFDEEPEQAEVAEMPEAETYTTPPARISKRMRPQSNEQIAEQQYQQGYTLLQEGDRKGAEDAWRKALRIDARHDASRESLAILYLSQSRRIEAAEQLQKGLTINPGNGKLALLYARIQFDAGDAVGAVNTLESAMHAKPQAADFYAFAAAVYQRQGEYKKSISAYQAALKQQSGQSVWWMGLGISLEGASMDKEALTAYQQAAKNGRLASKLRQYVEARIKALE